MGAGMATCSKGPFPPVRTGTCHGVQKCLKHLPWDMYCGQVKRESAMADLEGPWLYFPMLSNADIVWQYDE